MSTAAGAGIRRQKNVLQIMTKNISFSEADLKVLGKLVKDSVREVLTQEKEKARMLTTGQVMEIYHVSRTSVWRAVKAGLLHPRNGKGRQQLYMSEECEKALVADVK